MRTVKIAQLKDRLSEHLRAVEAGSEVVVTDRDRPIARIVPISSPSRRIRLIPPTRDFASVRSRRRKNAGWSITSTELLAEERRED
jgi:prevent-host-death family protein